MVKANCSIQLVYWDLKVSSKIIESKVKVNSMIMKTALSKQREILTKENSMAKVRDLQRVDNSIKKVSTGKTKCLKADYTASQDTLKAFSNRVASMPRVPITQKMVSS
jgi:hypothetical protein